MQEDDACVTKEEEIAEYNTCKFWSMYRACPIITEAGESRQTSATQRCACDGGSVAALLSRRHVMGQIYWFIHNLYV